MLHLGENHLLNRRQRQRHQAVDFGHADAPQRFYKQPIAGKNRDRVAVQHPRGRLVAPRVGQIDDVVMQQRRGVNQFDSHRQIARVLAGRRLVRVRPEARRQQRAQRPQPFAARGQQVVPRALRQSGPARALNVALDVRELLVQQRLQLREVAVQRVQIRGLRLFAQRRQHAERRAEVHGNRRRTRG